MVRNLSFSFVTCLLLLSTRAARAQESHASAAANELPDDAHPDVQRDDGAEAKQSAAKDAFGEGLRLLRNGEWHDAELKFRDSLMLVRHQSTEYDLAFVLYMQRRRREALAILEQLLHPEDEAPDLRYQQYGTLLKSRIQAELSTLRVLVTPSTAQVRIDGEAPIERGPERWLVVDPGDHHVEISAPGYVTKQVVFATGAGTDVEREVVLDRASSPAPPAPTTAAHAAGSDSATGHTAVLAPWIVMGTGGALLVTAVVTGLLAKDADDDFQKGCPTNKDCSPSLVGLRDRVVTLGRTTDILLVSGGVLAAGGLTWRLLLPSPKATADHAAFVTVNGRF